MVSADVRLASGRRSKSIDDDVVGPLEGSAGDEREAAAHLR